MFLLCWEFFKTGLFAIGGGLATIPFLTQMSEKYPHWFSLSMLTDMIAVSESTPGPIGINMATFIGYKTAGVMGAFLASFSITLPSFIIIIFISQALQKYRNNNFVNAAFRGIRPTVAGLIAAAGYSVVHLAIFIDGKIDFKLLILFILLLACTQINKLKKLHPIVYIGFSAAIGIIFSL